MNKWISYNDQKPPSDSPILILLVDGTMHVGYPNEFEYFGGVIETKWVTGGWESCCYCGGESRIIFEQASYTDMLGTHWMPLPEPPDIMYCSECKNESVACVCL